MKRTLISFQLGILLLIFWLMVFPTTGGPFRLSIEYGVSGVFVLVWLIVTMTYLKKWGRERLFKTLNSWKSWMLPLFAVAFTCLLLELCFRVSHVAEWGGGEGPLQITQGDSFYQFNSLGQRGPEVPIEHPAHTFVILGLGDSFLFGQGVSWNHTLLQQIEGLLRQVYKCHIKTINSALPGLNTHQEYNFFSRLGFKFDPDLVLIQFTLNDAETGLYRLKSFSPFLWEKHILWRSHLFFFLVKKYNERVQPYDMYILNLYNDHSEGWAKCQEGLQKIKSLCDQKKIKLVLAIYPMLVTMKDYPFEQIHAKVKTYAQSIHLDTIDLLAAFKKYNGPIQSLHVSRGDHHPNAKGHGLAADAIVDWILNESDIKKRIAALAKSKK